MTKEENRNKILEIYNKAKLPDNVRNYLKEEIDEFDRHSDLGEGFDDYWKKTATDKIDKKNPNNILIFYLLGLADKPKQFDEHKWDANDPPDIDVDVECEGKKAIFEYLQEKYGKGRVLPIGTFGGTKIKSAIQSIARVFEIPPSEVFPVTTRMYGLDESATVEELKKDYGVFNDFCKKYPEVEKHLISLLGVLRHSCLHETTMIMAKNETVAIKHLYSRQHLKHNKPEIAYINRKGNIKFTKKYEVAILSIDEMFEVFLENGEKFICTSDHNWFTNQGVKKLKDFDKNTKILRLKQS